MKDQSKTQDQNQSEDQQTDDEPVYHDLNRDQGAAEEDTEEQPQTS